MKTLIIAGTHSKVGKTTIALALMAALRQQGLTVQPFKVGPDFIDPGHHTAVCDRISRNLDNWMLSDETVLSIFHRACAGADVAVIEGVMGLFDGKGPDDSRGSTADIARLLSAPVILVVDASSIAASIAAVVRGYSEFDPGIQIAGVICNRVAGPRHYEYLESAIRKYTPVLPLGWLPRRADWQIPERHLGLTTIQDHQGDAASWASLADEIQKTVDLESLLEKVLKKGKIHLFSESKEMPCAPQQRANQTKLTKKMNVRFSRVAVARDAAFCFYYQDNLDLLEQAGGEMVPFSPLSDSELPDRTDVLYLGGGYPELHARQLGENEAMRRSIQRFHRQGGTIYAECGGLMYVCRELVDVSGNVFPMLDLLPARTVMQPRLAQLGYVFWRSNQSTPLGRAGTEARGHQFHYSRLEALDPLTYSAELEHGEERLPDGLISGNLLAGYAHLHFASNPAIPGSLINQSRVAQ
jgi:cobyrinic acid a,c-diamide synthase